MDLPQCPHLPGAFCAFLTNVVRGIVQPFLCGLLPILGNILSNTLIVCVGLTVDPQHALGALAFLVVVHKLEYFLNSKIIGKRIQNPMWMTLLGLILGERLMGIPPEWLACAPLATPSARRRRSSGPGA